MIIRSHGASHSFSAATVRLISKRRMRHLHVHAARGVGLVERSCRRRFSTSSRFRRILYQSCLKMSMNRANQQVWDASRGIVFAGDTKVVYPRLPLARYHTTPPDVAPGEPSTGGSCKELTAGQDAGDALGLAVTASPATTHIPPVDVTGAKADVPEIKLEDPASLIPPFTPLEFKIPDQVFRDAKLAAEGTQESFWTYSMYRGPGENGASDAKVKVHYCTSPHTTERTLKQYFMGEKILGFDLEWAGDAQKYQGARKNVSLVQLASPTRIGLFHLAAYAPNAPLVTPTLKEILEDPEITKLGVWIKGDSTRLSTYLGINPRGIFELSHLYKLVKYSTSGEYNLINKKVVSLANQVKDCLGLPLFKGRDVRASDWSQPLRMDQIVYSASDAYAAVQIYATLNHQREKLDPTPPLPHHAELNLPIRLAEGVLRTPPEEQEPEVDVGAEEKPLVAEDTETTSAIATSTFNMSVTIEPEDDNPPPPPPTATTTTTTSITTTSTTVTTTPTKPKLRPSTSTPSKPPPDARVTEASLWATQFRLAHPKTRAAPSSLRAYYLWHANAELSPAEVAVLLRDPPLQTSTVLSYILDAIRLGRVPFEKRRLRDEVLGLLDEEVLSGWRYEGVVRACEEGEVARGVQEGL